MMSASEQVRYYAYWCFERIEALPTVQKQGLVNQGLVNQGLVNQGLVNQDLTSQGLARSRNDFPQGL
jgi:hypothetical protein